MNALFYLTSRQIKNKILSLKKRPITAFFILIGIIYSVFVGYGLFHFFGDVHLNNDLGLAYVLSLFGIFTILGTLLVFIYNNGLKFTQGDTQFLFPSPISPKVILLYTLGKAEFLSIIFHNIIVFIGGYFVFGLPFGKAILVFLYVISVEILMDTTFAIFIYGDETQKGIFKKFAKIILLVILLWVCLVLYKNYAKHGLNPFMISAFIMDPWLKFIPVIGWYISGIHFMILGYGGYHIWNILLLYGLLIILFVLSYKMKIVGKYYEHSAEFAKKLDKMKKLKSQGRTDGIKVKYTRKKVATYYFDGAFALFDKQFNEYKRRRFFIFSLSTVLRASIGAFVLIFSRINQGYMSQDGMIAILFGFTFYFTFILTSVNEAWIDELKTVYFYLIPESITKKYLAIILWDVIRYCVEALIIILPLVVSGYLNFVKLILFVPIYILMQLYALNMKVITYNTLEPLLGIVGSMFGRYIGVLLYLGFVGGAVGLSYFAFKTINLSLLMGVIPSLILSLVSLWVASLTVKKMEALSGI